MNSNSLELVASAATGHLYAVEVGVAWNIQKEFFMARPPATHPTDGELEILRILWSAGPSSLSTICESLRTEREVATTTVATMLRVMLDKGLVKKGLVKREGARGAVWSAAVTQKSAARGMVRKLVANVFEGSAHRLATHLVEGGQLTDKQLAELRTLIDQQSKSPRK